MAHLKKITKKFKRPTINFLKDFSTFCLISISRQNVYLKSNQTFIKLCQNLFTKNFLN